MEIQSPLFEVKYHTLTATDIKMIVVMTVITVNHPLLVTCLSIVGTLFIGIEGIEVTFT